MADYLYHFYDIRSGAFIDTLPVEHVTFTVELRGVGTLTGDIPLYADGLDARRVLAATQPFRTKIFVERGNALVWGGWITAPRDYDSSTGRLTINAEETLGYFARRFLPTATYTNVDQLTLARAIISALQAADGGNVGLQFGAGTSGVLRSHTYAQFDFSEGLTGLTELSEAEGGFDFATQVQWDANHRPQETLLLGYPRLGRAMTGSGLVLEYNRFVSGGNVATYTMSDTEGLTTRTWGSTETEDGVQLTAQVDSPTLRAAGYPLIEQSVSFDGITDLPTLTAHTAAVQKYAGNQHLLGEFTVQAKDGVELGDWQLGDDALVRISDWRFPPDPKTGAPGFADYMRTLGCSITPGTEGHEKYVFTMGDYIAAI